MKVTIKREEPVVAPIKSVTLELSFEQAAALGVVSGNVCGQGPIRQACCEVYDALADVRKDAHNPYTDPQGLNWIGVVRREMKLGTN